MLRTKIASVMGAAIVSVALAVPAGAATTVAPVSGTLTSAISGSGKFSPAYPNSTTTPDGTLHNTRFRMTAIITNCDSSGVTGGKTAITGGKLNFSASVPDGTTCDDLAFDPPDFTSNNNRLVVQWFGINAGGGKTKVAQNKGLVSDATKVGPAWDLSTDAFEFNNTGPFQDEFATLHMQLSNAGEVGSCVFGASDLNGITFGTGSTISVTP